jgi:hypothetical protein
MFDRENFSAADPWSFEVQRTKSDELIFAGTTGNRHAIEGTFAGLVEDEVA